MSISCLFQLSPQVIFLYVYDGIITSLQETEELKFQVCVCACLKEMFNDSAKREKVGVATIAPKLQLEVLYAQNIPGLELQSI